MPREGFPVIVQNSNEWLPILSQGETFLIGHIVRMELNLYQFPNDAFNASRFLGQDPSYRFAVLQLIYPDGKVRCVDGAL